MATVTEAEILPRVQLAKFALDALNAKDEQLGLTKYATAMKISQIQDFQTIEGSLTQDGLYGINTKTALQWYLKDWPSTLHFPEVNPNFKNSLTWSPPTLVQTTVAAPSTFTSPSRTTTPSKISGLFNLVAAIYSQVVNASDKSIVFDTIKTFQRNDGGFESIDGHYDSNVKKALEWYIKDYPGTKPTFPSPVMLYQNRVYWTPPTIVPDTQTSEAAVTLAVPSTFTSPPRSKTPQNIKDMYPLIAAIYSNVSNVSDRSISFPNIKIFQSTDGGFEKNDGYYDANVIKAVLWYLKDYPGTQPAGWPAPALVFAKNRIYWSPPTIINPVVAEATTPTPTYTAPAPSSAPISQPTTPAYIPPSTQPTAPAAQPIPQVIYQQAPVTSEAPKFLDTVGGKVAAGLGAIITGLGLAAIFSKRKV